MCHKAAVTHSGHSMALFEKVLIAHKRSRKAAHWPSSFNVFRAEVYTESVLASTLWQLMKTAAAVMENDV